MSALAIRIFTLLALPLASLCAIEVPDEEVEGPFVRVKLNDFIRDQVFPGGVEVCDGLDNDCDGVTDEDDLGDPLIERFGTRPTQVGPRERGSHYSSSPVPEVSAPPVIVDGVSADDPTRRYRHPSDVARLVFAVLVIGALALIEAIAQRYPEDATIEDFAPWNDAFADAMRKNMTRIRSDRQARSLCIRLSEQSGCHHRG